MIRVRGGEIESKDDIMSPRFPQSPEALTLMSWESGSCIFLKQSGHDMVAMVLKRDVTAGIP